MAESRIVKTTCALDCPDTCGMLVTVENGRVTRLQGDPDHPFTRGFLCHKVANYDRRVYSPLRILHPSRRVGAKGEACAAKTCLPWSTNRSTPTRWTSRTWCCAVEEQRRRMGKPTLKIHPSDGRARQIRSGDAVRVLNDHGDCKFHAEVTEDTRPGVVVAEGLWWAKHMPGGRNVNALISTRLTDLGGGSTFQCNLVEVARCQ